jgi:putative hydrolase of the HAD superfamily
MAATAGRSASKAIMIDIGGVLASDGLPAAAVVWSTRLGISRQAFLAAVFGGSDDQVLTGRVSEPAWWAVVAGRLHAAPELMAELRRDLASRYEWDDALVAFLRHLRGYARTAVVSNAWPQLRADLGRAGLRDIADEIVLSCEIGYAKPDARIYAAALQRLAARPGDALFIDDTPGHVTAAQALGLTGHLHTSSIGTITRIEDFLASPGTPGPATAGLCDPYLYIRNFPAARQQVLAGVNTLRPRVAGLPLGTVLRHLQGNAASRRGVGQVPHSMAAHALHEGNVLPVGRRPGRAGVVRGRRLRAARRGQHGGGCRGSQGARAPRVPDTAGLAVHRDPPGVVISFCHYLL